jgi:choline-glycine betaine transporter
VTHAAIEAPPEVPAAAWTFAWSCLVGQLLALIEGGPDESNQVILSMLLGAVVVGWFSYGVLRARVVRVVVVWILFVLGTLALLVTMADDPTGWHLVQLVLTVVQFAFFVQFTRTGYYRWQRSRPQQPGPSLSGLVAIALLVGALGGVVGANEDEFSARVNF